MIDTHVLVVNAGSSSLKVRLLPEDTALLVERIGGDVATNFPSDASITNHHDAFEACLQHLRSQNLAQDIAVVGHRVVHGGESYQRPTLIDDDVLAQIEALIPLAPLHNPANLEGIRAAQSALPTVPQVAVFDTAFHSTLEARAYLYALPYELYENDAIRRYGFHGMSHDYVSRQAGKMLGSSREQLKIISLHLGNGASAAAIDRGKVVDSSMGMTPLEGLVMGTRSGDVDAGALLYLLQKMTPKELDTMLNKQSGLKGLSGISNDMRDIHAAIAKGNARASQALEVFVHRIKRYIGAFASVMNGLDVLVFTAGVGEHDAITRQKVCANLDFLGIQLDDAKNNAGETFLNHADSRVKILRIPTNEEAMIAQQSLACIAG